MGELYLKEGELEKASETILSSLEAEAANPRALSMMVLLSIMEKDESAALYWLEEVDEQPRIRGQYRKQLRRFFDEAFRMDKRD